jgi:uncharacterized coiled-coil protein SlyX
MNARLRYGAALIIALALTGSAIAETAEDSNDRFTMSPADGGFLRLDKKTGAVAMCAHTGNTWACTPVQDQTIRAAPGELSRLEQENRKLKDRVKALEEALETSKPPLPEGPPGGKMDLPTDEQVDKALDHLQRVYKKIRDHMKDLDKPSPPTESAPPPDNPTPRPAPPKGTL